MDNGFACAPAASVFPAAVKFVWDLAAATGCVINGIECYLFVCFLCGSLCGLLLAALWGPLCCGPLLDRRLPLAAFRSSFCLRHAFSACRPPPPLWCSRTWYRPGGAPNPPGLVSTTTWITLLSTLPWFSLTFTAQLNRGAGQQW